MGEYAIRKSDSQQIKIGTCSYMYYLRWDDRNKVEKLGNNTDASIEPNLYWRLPLPEDDSIKPGDYENHRTSVILKPNRLSLDVDGYDYHPPSEVDPGSFYVYHRNPTLILKVTCYHGEKRPETGPDTQILYHSYRPKFELCGIKNHKDKDEPYKQELLPLVRCLHCNEKWRDSWDNVLPYVEDKILLARLTDYANLGPFAP